MILLKAKTRTSPTVILVEKMAERKYVPVNHCLDKRDTSNCSSEHYAFWAGLHLLAVLSQEDDSPLEHWHRAMIRSYTQCSKGKARMESCERFQKEVAHCVNTKDYTQTPSLFKAILENQSQ